MHIKPFEDRVLIEPEEVKKSKGGIILTDTAKKKPRRGKVVEAGTDEEFAKKIKVEDTKSGKHASNFR